MQIEIQNEKIAYTVKGMGPSMLLLHGWGQSGKTFDYLARELEEDYTVYQIDLPGFGESTLKKPWSLLAYAKMLHSFCLELKIEDPIILGHSFGGRVAISYASRYPLKKLILVASPGIKQKLSFWKKIKIVTYKLLKKMNINIKMGSKDYQKANHIMKETLVMAIHEDLTMDLKEIKVPTVLIWGEKDREVPILIGKRMNQLIHHSGFVVIPNSGHFPYIEKFRYFLIVLRSFLSSDSE